MRRVPWHLLPLLGAGLVLALPWLGLNLPNQRQVLLICILALLVSGLNLSLGYAGELALGQAAMYAAGAYVTGYLAVHGHPDVALGLVVAAAAALAVGLLSGFPGVRLGGWSLAMVSFFLVLLVPEIILIFPAETGGAAGLFGIPNPTLFGAQLSTEDFYLVVVAVTALWFVVLRNLVTSRHGVAFRVLRQSPVLASSLGISVYRMKLTAYAVGAIPAGLAGSLYAYLDRYLNPDSFTFSLAITALAASVLGGSTSVYGALIGAAVMQLGPLRVTSFQQYSLVAYGIFLIVFGVLLGQGVTGLTRKLWRRVARPAAPAATDDAPAPTLDRLPGAGLTVDSVSKSFGGLHALREVSLTAPAGEITAVIGPNGSGKTTLLNIVSGFYRLDDGRVSLAGVPLPGAPHRVARAGIARTFQTPLVPKGISVAEAVRAGRYATQRAGMPSAILRLPGFRRARAADAAEADRVLRIVGIQRQAGDEAVALPVGTRRLLELARGLIARPKVLLLDEVASGLDEDEIDRLATLIRAVRDAGGTVILVEHNFGLVLRLADRIHVLAQGRLIASGTPAEIEAHPAVLREYLGMAAPSDEEARDDAVA